MEYDALGGQWHKQVWEWLVATSAVARYSILERVACRLCDMIFRCMQGQVPFPNGFLSTCLRHRITATSSFHQPTTPWLYHATAKHFVRRKELIQRGERWTYSPIYDQMLWVLQLINVFWQDVKLRQISTLNERHFVTLGKHWNPFSVEALPRTPLGELTTSLKSPSRLGRGNTLSIPHPLDALSASNPPQPSSSSRAFWIRHCVTGFLCGRPVGVEFFTGLFAWSSCRINFFYWPRNFQPIL